MLNKKLKSARLAAGFSQDQTIENLREHGLDISKAALSYYENGKRTPGATMIRELARIYGTTAVSFLKKIHQFKLIGIPIGLIFKIGQKRMPGNRNVFRAKSRQIDGNL